MLIPKAKYLRLNALWEQKEVKSIVQYLLYSFQFHNGSKKKEKKRKEKKKTLTIKGKLNNMVLVLYFMNIFKIICTYFM